jgi:hypothetical protein
MGGRKPQHFQVDNSCRSRVFSTFQRSFFNIPAARIFARLRDLPMNHCGLKIPHPQDFLV